MKKKVCSMAAMPLALTVTSLIAVPSLAQKSANTPSAKSPLSATQMERKLAKRAALLNVDTRAIRPDGTRYEVPLQDEGGIAGAPFQNWTFEAPVFTGTPTPGTPVNGQNGFTAFQGCNPGALNAPVPVVTTSGAAMTGLQWITVPKGPCPNGALAGPFSPNTPQPAGTYTGTVNVRVNDILGADYDVVFQSPTQANIVSRVKFYYADFDGDLLNGDILVVVDADGAGPGGAAFVDSGVDYVQGQLHAVKVEVDGPGNTLKYYIDNVLVSTSSLTFAGANAGDRIEQFVGISDNWQINPADNGQFDDVVMQPGIGTVCTGNTNGDTAVNVNDLLNVITGWGPCTLPCPPTPCPADVSPSPVGDCQVNVNDLLAVITNWGNCP